MIATARSQEYHATLLPYPWTVQTLGDGFMCSDLHFIRRWHRFPQMLAALTYICVHLRNLRIVSPVTISSNSSCQLASVYHPDAFGNRMTTWQSGLWTDSYTTREGWGHNTKEFDGDTGLVYMHQRWYLPETGTFGSKAPMPPEDEVTFGFALSMPTLAYDPLGDIPMVGPECENMRRYAGQLMQLQELLARIAKARSNASCECSKDLNDVEKFPDCLAVASAEEREACIYRNSKACQAALRLHKKEEEMKYSVLKLIAKLAKATEKCLR